MSSALTGFDWDHHGEVANTAEMAAAAIYRETGSVSMLKALVDRLRDAQDKIAKRLAADALAAALGLDGREGPRPGGGLDDYSEKLLGVAIERLDTG